MNDDEMVKKIMSSSVYPTEPLSRGNSVGTGRGSVATSGGMSLNTIDYLSVPMQDEFNDDEDQINFLRQKSAKQWNRIVGMGVIFALVGAVIVAIIFYKEQQHHSSSPTEADDDTPPPPPLATCYVQPSCINYAAYSPLSYSPQGFTNLTGWTDVMSYNGCCNICVMAPTKIPTSSPTRTRSNSPTEAPTESPTLSPTVPPTVAYYDFLIMDFLWLPQFCHGLNIGHDFTVSHTQGSHCDVSIYQTTPRLSIHGLWPSKANTSLACCSLSGSGDFVSTLDPLAVSSWPIWSGLELYWFDPTISNVVDDLSCSVCYLLNHEWQKHGSCYATMLPLPTIQTDTNGEFATTESENSIVTVKGRKGTLNHKEFVDRHVKLSAKLSEASSNSPKVSLKDIDTDEFRYFEAGLYLRDMINDEIDSFSNYAGQVTTAEELRGIFPDAKVNIVCDPQDSYISTTTNELGEQVEISVQVMAEIQTCWHEVKTSTGDVVFEMMDCPKPYESVVNTACTGAVYVRPFTSSFQSHQQRILKQSSGKS